LGSLKHGKGLEYVGCNMEYEIIWGDHFSNVKKIGCGHNKRATRAI